VDELELEGAGVRYAERLGAPDRKFLKASSPVADVEEEWSYQGEMLTSTGMCKGDSRA